MIEQPAEPCAEADKIAAAYAQRYDWADEEALKLYFRLELVNDTLRDSASRLHEATMPGAKGWSVAVLRALYLSPRNALSHAEIGAQTRVPAANVTYHVDILQQGGYVRRVPHETDRRIMLVELTPQGKSLCDRLISDRARFITGLGLAFDEDERHLFNQLLGRLQRAITAPAEEPSDRRTEPLQAVSSRAAVSSETTPPLDAPSNPR